MTDEVPFTLRSLVTVTESPSFKIFPFASLITFVSSLFSVSDSKVHSWAHSGQTKRFPSS